MYFNLISVNLEYFINNLKHIKIYSVTENNKLGTRTYHRENYNS